MKRTLALLIASALCTVTVQAANWREVVLPGRDVDSGAFSFQEIEGDFDLTETVTVLQRHGRVGLMVRECAGADARFEMIYVVDDGRVGTDARLGELAYHSPGTSESSKPMSIRLRAARCGDEIALCVVDAQPCTPHSRSGDAARAVAKSDGGRVDEQRG